MPWACKYFRAWVFFRACTTILKLFTAACTSDSACLRCWDALCGSPRWQLILAIDACERKARSASLCIGGTAAAVLLASILRRFNPCVKLGLCFRIAWGKVEKDGWTGGQYWMASRGGFRAIPTKDGCHGIPMGMGHARPQQSMILRIEALTTT